MDGFCEFDSGSLALLGLCDKSKLDTLAAASIEAKADATSKAGSMRNSMPTRSPSAPPTKTAVKVVS